MGAITVSRAYPDGEGMSVVSTEFRYLDREHFCIVQRPLQGVSFQGRFSGSPLPLISALWVEDGNVIGYRALVNERTVAVVEHKTSLKEFYDGLKLPVPGGLVKPGQKMERLPEPRGPVKPGQRTEPAPLAQVVAGQMMDLLPVRLQFGFDEWTKTAKAASDDGGTSYQIMGDAGGGGGWNRLSFQMSGSRIVSQSEHVDYGFRAPRGHTMKTSFYWGSLYAKEAVFKRPSQEELEGMRKVGSFSQGG